MIFDEHDLAGGIYIFSEDREIIRELTYAEFQALVDAYVPAVDLSNRELYAVYVEINSDYKIKTAVFFLVRFSSRGFVDPGWSVPLFQLALRAARGPDLGAGPIALACKSQCPIKEFARLMWNPDMRAGQREFKALREAAVRNRMAIQFREPDPEAKRKRQEEAQARAVLKESLSAQIRKEYDHEFRDRMAQALRDQRLKASTLIEEHERQIAELKSQYNSRLEEYREMLDEHKSLLKEARERNRSLKETIDGQAQKIQGLREYFELKLEQAEASGPEQLRKLHESHEMEIESAVEAATKEFKELLQMREVEMQYRVEQEGKLLEELEQLRIDHQELVANSGDQLLSKMLEKGISLMTYQPGAGHITLPVSDVAKYMENPVAYVAAYCGVSESHYNAWFEHYHVPICRANNADGETCGENINRVESPADFIIGESDCCFKHRTSKKPRLKLAGK